MNDHKIKPLTQGVHHIGLTVRNLDEARHFFTGTLKFSQIAEKPDYPAVILSDEKTLISLWQVRDPNQATAFNRKNVIGLHHIAFSLSGHEALESLYSILVEDASVKIEFAPEPIGNGPKQHMMCTIPGGEIRVEFIA